jgi:outer membrane receptor protein involved in Fe transport
MPEMVRGPRDFNMHTTLAKSFSLGEKRLQVRADVFNVLNRKNYSNPQTNMNNADFGRITGAGRPRVFQLGARLTF